MARKKTGAPNDSADSTRERVGEFVTIFKRGKRWHLTYTREGQQIRRALKTESKKRARDLALAEERDVVVGAIENHRRRTIGIDDGLELYLDSRRAKNRKRKTLDKYDYCFSLVQDLARRLGLARLDQIDMKFVDAFERERAAQGRKPKTIRNDLVTLKQVLNWALKRKYLRENPLANLTFEKLPTTPQPFWTKEQVDRILIAAEGHRYHPILLFIADTGCRVGEAIWTTWDCVDLTPGHETARIEAKEGWTPKTGDQRSIPLSPRVADALRKQAKSYKWCFTASPSVKCPQRGRQVDARRLLAYLKRLLKNLELPGHIHTFRHSFISHALTSGVPEAIVRSWVGHVDQEILKRYTHIASAISREAMRKLSATNGHKPPERPDSA